MAKVSLNFNKKGLVGTTQQEMGLYCRTCIIPNCNKCMMTGTNYECVACKPGFAYDNQNMVCINLNPSTSALMVKVSLGALFLLLWR